MEEYLRKLALWHTKTFKPIMTHDELEPIMATLGFITLPLSSSSSPVKPGGGGGGSGSGSGTWKEYVFTAGGYRKRTPTEPLVRQRVRLPYPRIDGLHIYTYRAFIDAVSFYLGKSDISDLFHVRGMPLHRIYDRTFDKKFRRMEEDEVSYVYREGTLDHATFVFYSSNNNNNNNNSNSTGNNNSKSTSTTTTTTTTTISSLVSLKDIIV